MTREEATLKVMMFAPRGSGDWCLNATAETLRGCGYEVEFWTDGPPGSRGADIVLAGNRDLGYRGAGYGFAAGIGRGASLGAGAPARPDQGASGRAGPRAGVPLDDTWSCYDPQLEPCGPGPRCGGGAGRDPRPGRLLPAGAAAPAHSRRGPPALRVRRAARVAGAARRREDAAMSTAPRISARVIRAESSYVLARSGGVTYFCHRSASAVSGYWPEVGEAITGEFQDSPRGPRLVNWTTAEGKAELETRIAKMREYCAAAGVDYDSYPDDAARCVAVGKANSERRLSAALRAAERRAERDAWLARHPRLARLRALHFELEAARRPLQPRFGCPHCGSPLVNLDGAAPVQLLPDRAVAGTYGCSRGCTWQAVARRVAAYSYEYEADDEMGMSADTVYVPVWSEGTPPQSLVDPAEEAERAARLATLEAEKTNLQAGYPPPWPKSESDSDYAAWQAEWEAADPQP